MTKQRLIWVILGLMIVAAGIVLARNSFVESSDTNNTVVSNAPRDITPSALTESLCSDAGGTWQDCGSACRGEEMDVCIDVCIEYCLCKGIEQCPAGFQCLDVLEGEGVCRQP